MKPHLRRSPFRFLIIALAACGCLVSAAAPAFQTDPEQKALRKKAAERPRRLLYNNDGNEPVHMEKYSIQGFLDRRTTYLIDSQVDSIFYCTYAAGLGLFTHDTKVAAVFLDTERHKKNTMPEFLKNGTDPLREIIKFARQHGKEAFWSLRMNDTHDGSGQAYGPILFNANPFKTKHPEWLLGSKKKPPFHGKWTGMNYEVPEVRDLVFGLIEEVCRNYDVDGIELDFFRHPTFFKYPAQGQGVTQAQLQIMTDLMRRIRLMIDVEGKKRGRPILVSMRVPDSIEYCRAIGIDIERWLADDLLDLLMTTSYIRLNEWDYSVKLGHKYGVKVYPSLDEPRVDDKAAQAARMSADCYRGRAAEVLAQGADGVYLYNFFGKRPLEILKHAGDAAQLARMDRDYYASVLGKAHVAGGAFPHAACQKVETLNPANAKRVQSGDGAEARIFVADDFAKTPPASLKLRLRFAKGAPQSSAVRVTLNGKPLPDAGAEGARADGEWLEFLPSAALFRQGTNNVRVRLAKPGAPQIVWTDLVLQVRVAAAGR